MLTLSSLSLQGFPDPYSRSGQLINCGGKSLASCKPPEFPRPRLLSNQNLPLWRSPSSPLLFSVRGDRTLLWPGRGLGFNPKKTKPEVPNPPQNGDLPVQAQVGLFWNVGKNVHILSSCYQYLCVVQSSQLCQGFQFSPINTATL